MSHTVITQMVDVQCCKCQVLFSVTSYFRDRYKQTHNSFYCPAGHKQYWPQESDEEKLKLELEEMKNEKNFHRERSQPPSGQPCSHQRKSNEAEEADCKWRLSLLQSHLQKPCQSHEGATSGV